VFALPRPELYESVCRSGNRGKVEWVLEWTKKKKQKKNPNTKLNQPTITLCLSVVSGIWSFWQSCFSKHYYFEYSRASASSHRSDCSSLPDPHCTADGEGERKTKIQRARTVLYFAVQYREYRTVMYSMVLYRRGQHSVVHPPVGRTFFRRQRDWRRRGAGSSGRGRLQ